MADIEHPDITHAHKTGHSREDWRNMHANPQDNAVTVDTQFRDYYGTPLDLNYDYFVVTNEGDYVADRNLQRYLTEVLKYEVNYEI